jgi:hypothetical protein
MYTSPSVANTECRRFESDHSVSTQVPLDCSLSMRRRYSPARGPDGVVGISDVMLLIPKLVHGVPFEP